MWSGQFFRGVMQFVLQSVCLHGNSTLFCSENGSYGSMSSGNLRKAIPKSKGQRQIYITNLVRILKKFRSIWGGSEISLRGIRVVLVLVSPEICVSALIVYYIS